MSLRQGPAKRSQSQTKAKRKMSDDEFVTNDVRDKIIAAILTQLDKQSLKEDGTIFDVPIEHPKDNTQKNNYKVLVSQNLSTNEIEFHIFDPKDTNNLLGEGGQGKVIVVQNMITRAKVAVKVQYPKGASVEEDLQKERSNLKKAQRLIGTTIEYDQDGNVKAYYTLMPYYPGMELRDYLYEKDPTKDKESPEYYVKKKDIGLLNQLNIIVLSLRALIALHKDYKLAHRDIKSANLVVGHGHISTAVNIVDLGSALDLTDKSAKDKKTRCGTYGYMPPEMLLPVKERPDYSFASDVWAFGVVVAEILSCRNYQALLSERMKAAKAKDTLPEDITFDDIKTLLSDVFIASASSSAQNNAASIQLDENKIRTELSSFVSLLLNPNPDSRPNLDLLEKIASQFSMYYLSFRTLSYSSPDSLHQEFRRLKRQSTVAVLPSVVEKKQSKSEMSEESEKRPTATADGSQSAKPKLTRSKSVKKIDKDLVKPKLSDENDKKDASRKRSKSHAPKQAGSATSTEEPALEKSKKAVKASSQKKQKKDGQAVDEALASLLKTLSIEEKGPSDPEVHEVGTSSRDKVMLSLYAQRTRAARVRLSTDMTFLQPEMTDLLQMTSTMTSQNPQVAGKVEEVKKACQSLLPNSK